MENRARIKCILLILLLLTSINICVANNPTHLPEESGCTQTQLNENVEKLTNLIDPVSEIVKSMQYLDRLVKQKCPEHYERVINGCFYHWWNDDWIQTVDWETARLYCQAINGDLAVVDDIPRFIAYYKNKHHPKGKPKLSRYHWYGAYRVDNEIQYVNGTVLSASSTPWEEGQPGSGYCVALDTLSQKLITKECNDISYFFCRFE